MPRAEKTPYKNPAWRRVRVSVLERDGGRCQIRGEGCQTQATDVDHIVPWRDGGAWFDLDNLRASCKHCNGSRSSHQKHQSGWTRASTEITVTDIAPPPDGAVIIDMARLAAAVGADGQPTNGQRQAARIAYDKLVAELRRGELDTSRAVIVSDLPDAAQRFPHHLNRLNEGAPADAETVHQNGGLDPGRW